MKHRILEIFLDAPPYEKAKVELVPTNIKEKNEIINLSGPVEDYLAMKLGAVKILEKSAPFFLIRRIKK